MEVDMIERILLIIAFEMLVMMSVSLAFFIFIFILRYEKGVYRKEPSSKEKVKSDEDREAEAKRVMIQKQFENMMNYTGREQSDYDD